MLRIFSRVISFRQKSFFIAHTGRAGSILACTSGNVPSGYHWLRLFPCQIMCLTSKWWWIDNIQWWTDTLAIEGRLRSLSVSTIAQDSRTYHVNGGLKIVDSLWSLHLGISTDHFTILVAAYISLVICERFRNRSRPSIYSNCYMLTISPSPDLDSWSGIGTACLQECRLDDQSSIECMAPKKNKQVMSFWPQHWAQIRHLLRNKPTQDWCPWVSKIYSAAKVTSEKLFGNPTSICVT